MTTTAKPDPATLGGRNLADAAPHERDAAIDNATPPAAKPADTAEAEDLRARLEHAGVQVAPDTSLAGLRELWATFGDYPEDPAIEQADTDRELQDAADELADVLNETTGRVAEIAGIASAEEARDILSGDKTASDAAREAHHAAQTAATADAGPQLFDASDYERADLQLPKIDGHPIDRIAVTFSGQVMLDRANPDHVALWRRLKLGRKVELWVEAKGLGYAGQGATNRDGELDVIVAKRTVAIQTVRILNPEELHDAAAEVVAQARDAAQLEADTEAAAALD